MLSLQNIKSHIPSFLLHSPFSTKIQVLLLLFSINTYAKENSQLGYTEALSNKTFFDAGNILYLSYPIQ